MFMKCNGNCFSCVYDDCILDFGSFDLSDLVNVTSDQIDSILFPSDSSSIVVPDYNLYPFIPSDDIPYNPKWKNQAKWREYYRSKMRGNRAEKISYTAHLYYINHKDEIRARSRVYYQEHREEILARVRLYQQNNREKLKVVRRENYLKNRDARLAYRREYYQKHRDACLVYSKEYYQKYRDDLR